MLIKGALFHLDNAPVHKSLVAMYAIRNCGFELVDYPPHPILLIWLPRIIIFLPTLKKFEWKTVPDR